MGIRLKYKVLKNLSGQTDIYQRIAEEHMIVSLHTIRRWARENKANGPLTTLTSLKIISQGTGIALENLTEECHDNAMEFNGKRVSGNIYALTGSDCERDRKHNASECMDTASSNQICKE